MSRFSTRFKWLMAVVATASIAVTLTALITASESGSGGADVRIQARQTDGGATEVALQVRNADHSWGERILPAERFLLADAEPGRWRSSTAIQTETDDASIPPPSASPRPPHSAAPAASQWARSPSSRAPAAC